MAAKINVAVAGLGYWGPNLARNFAGCSDARLVALCDTDRCRLEQVGAQYPAAAIVDDFAELIARGDVEAVAIATPVATHAELAQAALEADKHVLVEKPLAASVVEAAQLVRVAEERQRVLMVDHTFVYSGAVNRMKRIVDAGQLGKLYFIDSVRINLGLFQHDVNVVWDLATHDLSIVDYLLGRMPQWVSAFGASHMAGHGDLEDVAYLNLDFGGGLLASFHISWLSPVKIRHFILGGSLKSIVYNDLDSAERVKVYDRGITISEDAEARRGVLIGYRTGDIWTPHVDQVEPLAVMVREFTASIRKQRPPRTDGQAGLRVVRILEAAEQSIKSGGERVML